MPAKLSGNGVVTTSTGLNLPHYPYQQQTLDKLSAMVKKMEQAKTFYIMWPRREGKSYMHKLLNERIKQAQDEQSNV